MTRCLAGLVALVAAAPGVVWGQTFLSLGVNGPAGTAQAYAISEDGTTVVGQTGSNRAFRWRVSSGLSPLGDAPLIGYTLRRATDVSANGEVVVGIMSDGIGTRVWRTVGVEAASIIGGLEGFPNPRVASDGSTIVGGSSLEGARWTLSTGTTVLGPASGLPQGYAGLGTSANAVSSDGTVVVGNTRLLTGPPNNGDGQFQPCRWTPQSGSVAVLNNGMVFAGGSATDVSGDGSVIVGTDGNDHVFRWTALTGYVLIGLNPLASTVPVRVSSDGNTVVDGPVLWTAATGFRPIETVLAEAGCNFTGWSGLRVTDVSGNGRALCGYGVNPLGQTEAWYATVPAPGGVVGFVMIAGVMGGRRRRVG